MRRLRFLRGLERFGRERENRSAGEESLDHRFEDVAFANCHLDDVLNTRLDDVYEFAVRLASAEIVEVTLNRSELAIALVRPVADRAIRLTEREDGHDELYRTRLGALQDGFGLRFGLAREGNLKGCARLPTSRS
jgi:hypothetical protein